MVPSDIAAGIVLLYHKQRHRRRAEACLLEGPPTSSESARGIRGREVEWERGSEAERGECASLTRSNESVPASMCARSVKHDDFYKVAGLPLLDVAKAVDRKALEEVSHFSRYALAIYTW